MQRSRWKVVFSLMGSWLWLFHLTSAQNLVPNPGFDFLTSCPRVLNGDSVIEALPWYTPRNATNNGSFGTADVFNVCASQPVVGVPENVKGSQMPLSGDGYAGFISYATGGQTGTIRSAREYLQVRLNRPLESGEMVYAGFYISLADRYCAVQNAGIHFSEGPVPTQGDNIFNYDPQIEANGEWLNDKVGWMLVEGCYTATGGENFITIGNFRHNMESPLYMPCHDVPLSYYYLDNVFVVSISQFDLGSDFGICPGDTIDLVPAGGQTSYLWHDQSTASTFTVTAPGNYHVTISNICGTASDSITAYPLVEPPTIFLQDSVWLCQGESITLDPMVGFVDYLWSNGSAASSIHVVVPGEYSLTVENGCGSDEASIIVVDAGPPPLVSLGDFISLCHGSLNDIEPISSYVEEWLWYDGSTGPTVSIADTGLIFVTGLNDCGFATDSAIVVQGIAKPVFDLGPDMIKCEGEFVLLSPGITGVSYLWQDGSTAPVIIALQSGVYSVEIENECGKASDTVNIDFITRPNPPTLGRDTVLCKDEVLTLSWEPKEGETIQWDNGTDFKYRFIEDPGTYWLIVGNLCGASSDTIDVDVLARPDPVYLGPDTTICFGDTLTLAVGDVVTGSSISWNNGSQDHLMDVVEEGMVTVVVENQCGKAHDEILVVVNMDFPQFAGAPMYLLCDETTLRVDVTQPFDAQYIWTDGVESPIRAIDKKGVYDVIVSSLCFVDTFSIKVDLDPACIRFPDIYVPNVFSPNNDLINDEIEISNFENSELFSIEFSIYDRWGNLLFYDSTLPISWDGSAFGSQAPTGVYGYVLKIINVADKQAKSDYGDITIIR